MIITKELRKRGKGKEKGMDSRVKPENDRKLKFRLRVRRCRGYRLSDGDTSAYRDVFRPGYGR